MRGTVIILVSLATSIVASTATFYVLNQGLLLRPDPVEVPDLGGLDATQARETLEGRGLLLFIASTEPSDSVGRGKITSQTPLTASMVMRGESVRVRLSSRPERVLVPNISGLALEEAKGKLIAAGLEVGEVTHKSSADVDGGAIALQIPGAGASVPIGSKVDLVVSAGRVMVDVPEVKYHQLAWAKKTLMEAGLVTGKIRYVSSDNHDIGTVVAQSPDLGARAAQGTPVDLSVVND